MRNENWCIENDFAAQREYAEISSGITLNLIAERDLLLKENKRLRKGIEWWLNERMKNYTDNQYGIREMKELIKIKI